MRAPPPGAMGEVDVGAEDAARLLEPEPHVPDSPEVSGVPEDPEFIGISGVTGVADGADIALVPEFAAVAGADVPTIIPPPSKLAREPNISIGEVAAVEHAALLMAAGIVIVPVVPVGSGLIPGEVISVEPSGRPVGEPAPPVATPSGEVASIMGVGVVVASNCPPTCAQVTLQAKSAGRITAMNETLTRILPCNIRPVLAIENPIFCFSDRKMARWFGLDN